MNLLILLIILFSLPSLLFMIVADVNGQKKWVSRLFIKLPAYIAITLIVIYFLKQHQII